MKTDIPHNSTWMDLPHIRWIRTIVEVEVDCYSNIIIIKWYGTGPDEYIDSR